MLNILSQVNGDVLGVIIMFCDPIQVLLSLCSLSRSIRDSCIRNDRLWREFCSQIGFQEKLFKEVSWLGNYKYYCLHILREYVCIDNRYKRRCCNYSESINILLLSGIGDGRELILKTIEKDNYSINIRSQFSANTGLTRRQIVFQGCSMHIVSFYYHLILTFPGFFPSFPLSDSYRDVIVWIVDASRFVRLVPFDEQSGLADILYNRRYYHYTRKCLHMLLTGIAPWVPLVIVATNQDIKGAMCNAEIIKVLRLWKEHRLWRLYSLTRTNDSAGYLFVHCINEIHRIQYHLSNAHY